MSQKTTKDETTEVDDSFPSEVDLLAAGYVRASFHETPDVSKLKTAVGHPFPTHEEIVRAGYVPLSRRAGRLQSRPRVGQMYWVDFPHDAYAPEFEREHPGIVVRAAKKLQNDTCVVVPVTKSPQKMGTHFHTLSRNPNPKGHKDGIIAHAVCDHLYTVNTNRLRPLVNSTGKPIFPTVEPDDMEAIFMVMEKVLNRSFCTIEKAAEVPMPTVDQPEKRQTKNGRALLTVKRN